MNDTSDQEKEAAYDSSTTISWKALPEAEKLYRIDYILQLIDFIDKEKNKMKRDKAYFILAHIVENTNDNSAVQYLIHRVDYETDKYIIASLLDRIANLHKPLGTDLIPIINAT